MTSVSDLFYYLSPLIIPILPKAAGANVISLNLANALRDIADDDDDVIVTFNVQTFEGGERIGEEKFDVRARDSDRPIAVVRWMIIRFELS